MIERYREMGGKGPVWSQLSLCWDPDREEAVDRAYRIWPNTALAGQLAQDLRTVGHMEQAIEMIDRSRHRKALPCGPDSAPIIESIEKAAAMGIDHIYLHQIGDPLDGFIEFWRDEIRPEIEGSDGAPRSWDGGLAALWDAHLISDRRHTRNALDQSDQLIHVLGVDVPFERDHAPPSTSTSLFGPSHRPIASLFTFWRSVSSSKSGSGRNGSEGSVRSWARP